MPWSSFQGQNHRSFSVTSVRRRWEGNFLATGERRGGVQSGEMRRGTVFTCVLYTDSGSSKPVCLKVILHSLKKISRQTCDLKVVGCWRLLCVGDEAVCLLCGPALKTEGSEWHRLSGWWAVKQAWRLGGEASPTSPETPLPVVGPHLSPPSPLCRPSSLRLHPRLPPARWRWADGPVWCSDPHCSASSSSS